MALDKATLKSSIQTLLQDMMEREEASFDEFATKLSDAVDIYVKTGTVTVAAGIPVATTGSPSAQTGTTTATGTGTIA
jgi:hypothetical protein